MLVLEKLLHDALRRKEARLIQDYARLPAGSPEQEEVAMELEVLSLEMDMDFPVNVPTKDDNWGQDALDAISHPTDIFFPGGCGGPLPCWIH